MQVYYKEGVKLKDNNKELYKLIQEGMDAERKGETNSLSNVIAQIKENLR